MIRQQEQEAAEGTAPAGVAGEPDPTRPLLEIGEQALLQAAKPYPPNYQAGNAPRDRLHSGQQRQGEVTEPHREVFGKVMWNLVASAELVFGTAREQRAQSEGGGSGTFLEPSELKVMKRLLVHGSEVIQGLAELRPQSEEPQGPQGPRPTVLFFAEFFRRVRPLQLRDILADIGPRLFARVVEAKTKLRIQHAQRNGAAAGGSGPGGQAHHEQDD